MSPEAAQAYGLVDGILNKREVHAAALEEV
jgi:ATP-dependent protease ClpP protease subunit